MPFRSWCEVDKILTAATESATPKQRELGQQANTQIIPQMPKIVAAARLRLALVKELNLPAASPVSDRCKFRLKILRRRSDGSISPQTEEEAKAWVTYLRLVRRRESLSKLKLHEGDIVKTKDGELAEVSSIGQDGRVFFKGGRGFGTWPDLISVIARSADDSPSATKARQQAENVAARRNPPAKWSTVKAMDLAEFATKDVVVSEDDIAQLEVVITTAEDERPIQKFLEANGHLLTVLLGGRDRYCIPQKRLGAEYVPDFVIGDIDSLGVRWMLIELETPRSRIYLKSGDKLDKKTQKGIDQVIGWRNWLSNNISYARQRRSDDGLGLFDIRENSDAVVIVGRRSRCPERKMLNGTNIARQTYGFTPMTGCSKRFVVLLDMKAHQPVTPTLLRSPLMTIAEDWAQAIRVADRVLYAHQNAVAEDEPSLLVQRIAQNPTICGGPVEHFSQAMPIWAPKTAEEDGLRPIDVLYGIYDPNTRAIEIFVNRIDQDAKSIGAQPNELLEIVRIHEYAHAAVHVGCRSGGVRDQLSTFGGGNKTAWPVFIEERTSWFSQFPTEGDQRVWLE